jgi:propanediol dehydratase small subunit
LDKLIANVDICLVFLKNRIMDKIKERITSLEAEKKELQADYKKSSVRQRETIAALNMRICMEVEFLKILNIYNVSKVKRSETELLIAFFNDLKEQVPTYRIRDMNTEHIVDVFLSN